MQDSEAPTGYSGQAGHATSIATAYLAVRDTDGKQLSLVGAKAENINGSSLLSFDTGLLNLPDTVSLSLEGNLFLQLGYGYYYNEFGDERKVPSSGWLGAENSFLTIHTAALPVPEPSTWMMLLSGLLLPWAVSRRQARARAA
ncbi:PEP-CTERM sorting domain-containing protein [Janthinobacterium lividum]|nr:PEP-CTERM sorting domain-containing protein [Janthinobacterium lividum]